MNLALFLLAAANMPGIQRMLLMLPLCLSIAVVHKTIQCEDLSEVFGSSLVLWLTIVVGMYGVGVGLWLLFNLMV